ncbi:hypothetical protein A0O36_02647 [Piscirickettsiaceae bacterium NZ-RLO1]|nr:hypothetical protein A0O36_02647 [Piscirickettsiaceae bacterium NZ-RLO1]
MITQQLKAGQLKVHGLGGGSVITFEGEKVKVPRGISKIWHEITGGEGNFKWVDGVNAAMNKVKAEASSRSGYRGLTAVGLFFGSYRDAQTKDLYSKISQTF